MEYQYYEFAAIDKPLDSKNRDDLRAISSRATITATSFVNHYEYGNLKADPIALMKRYFDLFVYVANFGTRSFAIRVPKSVWNDLNVQDFAIDDEVMKVHNAGDNVILYMEYDEEEGFEEWDSGETWMANLAPLRSSLLAGNLDLLYALWLAMVDRDWIRDEIKEPIPGITEPSESLMALANFLSFDSYLLLASVRKQPQLEPDEAAIKTFIRGLTEEDKVELLARVYAGDDPHLGAKLRQRYKALVHDDPQLRSAGELKNLAKRLRENRERLVKAKTEAAKQQRDKEKAEARKKHIQALAAQGEAAWQEVENLIALRNAQGYDKAATILADLAAIAAQNGTINTVKERLAAIRDRHSGKRKFIERIDKISLD